MSIVWLLKSPRSTWRSVSSSSLRRIGWSRTSWCACLGVAARRLRWAPIAVAQGHDELLADGVDRRVGDLGEKLLEVAEQGRALVAEDRQGGVVAHRADRLRAGPGHRRQQHLEVLLGVAEGLLELAEVLAGLVDRGARLEVGEVDRLVAQPLAVGLGRRDLMLELLVVDDPPGLEVDEEELARRQAPEAPHLLGLDLEHAGLGAEDHPAVGGLHPPPGAQPVAIERGPHDAAVGEADRRRAVPRLHEHAVIGVERLEVLGDVVPVGVGLGHHHHRRVRQRATTEREQLEHVVERRRVRAVGADDRQDLAEVLAEQLGGELALAGAHPVDVAAERVDLAVVGDHPVRDARGPRTGTCSSRTASARAPARRRSARPGGPGRTPGPAWRAASPCRPPSARRTKARRSRAWRARRCAG